MNLQIFSDRLSYKISQTLREVFSFPHPVNEIAARMVAGMVAIVTLITILLDFPLVMIILAYGFLARVLTGPTLSPMGLVATRILAPRINKYKYVAGPPKRFAQMVGLVFSVIALVLHYGFGLGIEAKIVLGVLTVFASLECVLGFCTGCFVFGYLMRWGLVGQEVCDKCNDFVLENRSE